MVHQKENVKIHSIIFFKQIRSCTQLSKKIVQINIFLKMKVFLGLYLSFRRLSVLCIYQSDTSNSNCDPKARPIPTFFWEGFLPRICWRFYNTYFKFDTRCFTVLMFRFTIMIRDRTYCVWTRRLFNEMPTDCMPTVPAKQWSLNMSGGGGPAQDEGGGGDWALTGTSPLSREQNNTQTQLKTLPCRDFVGGR